MIPNKYQNVGESAIASYSYTDLAEGTGILQMNGFALTLSGSTTTNLSNTVLYSSKIEISGSYSVAGFNIWNKILDTDFDLTAFNTPRRIKGTGYIRMTYACADSSGGGLTPTHQATIRIRKWDGTTETEIAIVSSAETATPVATTTFQTLIMPITIPLTHFKKGETLRTTVELWLKSAGNPGTSTGELWHGSDPQNRDGTKIIPSGDSTGNKTTNLKVWIPFVIDL